MAIATLKFACKPNLYILRPPPFQCIRKVVPKSVAVVESEECSSPTPERGNKKVGPSWKKLNSKELGLRNSMITSPTKKVLNILKKKGLLTLFAMDFGDGTKELTCFWVGILALHNALSDEPRVAAVVAAFSIAVHNSGNLSEAVDIARRINKPHDSRFPELLDPSGLDAEDLEDEILDLAESVKKTLSHTTTRYLVSQAMANYPQAPHSDMVFIPLGMYLKTLNIFECLTVTYGKKFLSKQDRKIDYESSANGDLQEVRHMFARVVFDTVYSLHLDRKKS